VFTYVQNVIKLIRRDFTLYLAFYPRTRWKIAKQEYGEAPIFCGSCYQQCYAEPSLMQARPFEYLLEKLGGADVSAYAPG